METSTMIRQLRRTAKKHENDKLHTFDTDISLMCTEVANRLEQLEKEKTEVRAIAIDEFAERLQDKVESFQAEINGFKADVLTLDYFVEFVDEIAEELKGGGE